MSCALSVGLCVQELTRRLLEEQNSEYEQALAADRQKEAQRAEERKRQEEQQRAQQEAESKARYMIVCW